MRRFRIPELLLGCFLTIAVFATGMLFNRQQSSQTQDSVSKQESANDSRNAGSPDAELAGSTWLTKDAAGFFTFGLVLVGLGQALLFFVQLRFMRKGMDDATIAASASRDGAFAAVEANEISRRNSVADRRPWLGIAEVKFVKPITYIEAGALTAVEITIKNAGHTPAFAVSVTTDFFLTVSGVRLNEFPTKFIERMESFGKFGGGAIFPADTHTYGHSLSLTRKQIDEGSFDVAAIKAMHPMLRVGVTYKSDQGTRYSTMASYRMMGVRLDVAEFPPEALSPTMWFCEAT